MEELASVIRNENSEDNALQIGSIFRGLRILSLAGEGSMGYAYLASHPILKTPFIIKTFKKQVSSFQEAYLTARIKSENVVSISDAGIENNIPFIILQFIDGIDLKEILSELRSNNWNMPINVVARIICDIAAGLHYVHLSGVVHCDIKPANIFLSGLGTSILGDFGIAIERKAKKQNLSLGGSPSFMAPEQWTNEEVTNQTDIYSLGATAHYLLTGSAPFHKSKGLENIKRSHLEDSYVIPEDVSSNDAVTFFSLIKEMLAKKKQNRPTNSLYIINILKAIKTPAPQFRLIAENKYQIGNIAVLIVIDNIAERQGDVIVNAANSTLEMSAGVARLLKDKAGPEIEMEAIENAPAAMGDVIWTSAYGLDAQWVAHAVAALDGAICIQRTMLRILLGAEKKNASKIVISALGTDVGKVPMEMSANLMLTSLHTFSSLQPNYVSEIEIVLTSKRNVRIWREQINNGLDAVFVMKPIDPTEGIKHILITNTECTVGRSNFCDYVLEIYEISRQHARLLLNDDKKLFLVDLDSANGTYVNDNKIDSVCEVQENDVICFGLVAEYRVCKQ